MSKPIFAGLLSLCLAAALTIASHEARAQTAAPGPAPIPPPPAAAPPAAAPGAVAQAPSDTGCEERNFLDGYYFPGGRKTFDDERYSAFALRLNRTA